MVKFRTLFLALLPFVIVLMILSLTGCQSKEEIAAEKARNVERAKRRAQIFQEMLHTCDTQDGILDIQKRECSRYSCREALVICKNGMQKPYPNYE